MRLTFAPLMLVIALATGCACTVDVTTTPPIIGPGGVSDGGRRDGGSDGGSADGGDAGFDAGCPFTCSDDQLARIDCAGRAVPCDAGLGCANGTCMDACAAADLLQSTVGCEFFVAGVPGQLETVGSCHALYIANVWSVDVVPELSRAGTALPSSVIRLPTRQLDGTLSYPPLPDSGIPPGRLAIAFLGERRPAPDAGARFFTACPEAAAVSDYQFSETRTFDAIKLKTSAPVIATDIYPYGGAASHVTSASLLLPTSAWGVSHVAITPEDALVTAAVPPSYPLNPYVQLISAADATDVTVVAPVPVEGGPNVSGGAAGTRLSYRLDEGEVLQLFQPEQLSGARITSTRPLAVIGGHTCMNKPLRVTACDTAHQQLPAVSLLGSQYVGVRYPARTQDQNEPAVWRLVGAVDGTRLTWSPTPPLAPARLDKGDTVEFSAPGPFVVSAQDAQHPFLVTVLMTGGSAWLNEGDPDMVNLVPPAQYLKRYVFFTDPTYAKTHLVFVRQRTGGRFFPVTLDCGPPLDWRPVSGDFEYATLSWARRDADRCEDGVHTAHSEAAFGLTVWGTDTFTSYGFPAGMGVRRLNSVSVE